ncbi:MAG: hypothetical protein OD816_001383 [Thermodesulfobacterium sp.]|uniref:Uncharacterized protein n=1 Tax=Candidatus Thermodesulfobacterium syntrophicum TaxID=3060442 RepID=A0AAE3P5V0_9BACT|nr:hypothetical protein [Candidatus Thermodesulfobacterium syntrophicum]
MRRGMILGIILLFLLSFISSLWAGPFCCVAGKYRVSFKNTWAPPPLQDEVGKVHPGYIIIRQNSQCDKSIGIIVLDKEQNVLFKGKGTVIPVRYKCLFKGSLYGNPEGYPEKVEVKGELTKQGSIWYIKGKYDNVTPPPHEGVDGVFTGGQTN